MVVYPLLYYMAVSTISIATSMQILMFRAYCLQSSYFMMLRYVFVCVYVCVPFGLLSVFRRCKLNRFHEKEKHNAQIYN